jgi:8-oxo-dGTP pyrophosphatase MutT (NUDIX family)
VDGGRRHWGPLGGAGLLPFAEHQDETWVLLSQRGRFVQSAGTWSTPGGAIEPNETPWDAAVRETTEEIEGLGRLQRIGQLESACPRGCGWSYATFPAATAMTEVRVRDPWETSAVGWVPAAEVPAMNGLHPAFAAAWPQLAAAITSRAIRS